LYRRLLAVDSTVLPGALAHVPNGGIGRNWKRKVWWGIGHDVIPCGERKVPLTISTTASERETNRPRS